MMGFAREGASLKRSPLPRAPSSKDEGGDAGGEAASLREAPLPQTPTPEEQLALGLCASAGLVPPEMWEDSGEVVQVHGG